MKALKINVPVGVTSGPNIPSGSIVVINSEYADQSSQNNKLIPANINTVLYYDQQTYEEGKTPVNGVADFNTNFQNLLLPVDKFETVPTESLLIGAVQGALSAIYGAENIEVITINRI